MKHKILEIDPRLTPFAGEFDLRMEAYKRTKKNILQKGQTLSNFANGYLFFGFHQTEEGWFYREWAPGADQLYLTGDFNGWNRTACPMTRVENGVWEVFLPGKDALQDGQLVMTVVIKDGNELERIPAYARRVVQDKTTNAWNAQIHVPKAFAWTDEKFRPKKDLLIYECHIGMAQEEGKVGTYKEFTENVLPRIKKLGYNTM